jgi:hypothetical protein
MKRDQPRAGKILILPTVVAGLIINIVILIFTENKMNCKLAAVPVAVLIDGLKSTAGRLSAESLPADITPPGWLFYFTL